MRKDTKTYQTKGTHFEFPDHGCEVLDRGSDAGDGGHRSKGHHGRHATLVLGLGTHEGEEDGGSHGVSYIVHLINVGLVSHVV